MQYAHYTHILNLLVISQNVLVSKNNYELRKNFNDILSITKKLFFTTVVLRSL